MSVFSQGALNPGVQRREVFGWAMYDFANSSYTTVVITAVFAAYFVGGIAHNAEWATFAWTAALSTSYAIVMFTMPSLGAYVDARCKKTIIGTDYIGICGYYDCLGACHHDDQRWFLVCRSNCWILHG
jgi:MFS transporter, UMF1 family